MLVRIGARGNGVLPRPSQEILDALSDDLNTPEAVAALRHIFSRLKGGDQAASLELLETCEFLGVLRPDKLFAYNAYHVRTGPKMIASTELRRDVDEIQVAAANGKEERKNALISKLAALGIIVTEGVAGSIGYEVIGDGLDVDSLIASRNAARTAKNFKESDRIRDELLAKGIVLKDGPTGTTWEVKR
jgi:cysteinyl-tRNA synthetase